MFSHLLDSSTFWNYWGMACILGLGAYIVRDLVTSWRNKRLSSGESEPPSH